MTAVCNGPATLGLSSTAAGMMTAPSPARVTAGPPIHRPAESTATITAFIRVRVRDMTTSSDRSYRVRITLLAARREPSPDGPRRADRHHCVRTATLVEPRVTPLASLNRTNTRFAAGLYGTVPSPGANRPKVGVAPLLIVVVTVGPGRARQAPVPGSVSQIVTVMGSAVAPVSAVAVMVPSAPTLTVATAKTPVPSVPAMFTMPSLSG